MAKLADNKSKPTDGDALAYLDTLAEPQRSDSLAISKMMEKASGEKPKLWGNGLIGFGYVIITSPSGRTVEWFRIGFAPRKANISIYLTGDVQQYEAKYLSRLGKYKTGLGCLYVKKLADVDTKVLEDLIEEVAKKKA